MAKCWRCSGMGVLHPAILAQVKATLGKAYEAIPAEGNEVVLNQINEMRNLLSVTMFEAIEDLGG